MMKRLLILPILLISIAVLTSCGSSSSDKLIGTWKVSDVQTDFNESEVTPQMLAQVVEMQKQTHFRFLNDSTMVIISNSNTHEAKWKFEEEGSTITYFFSGMETSANTLGKFENDLIVQKSETPLGLITTIYTKE